MTKLFLFRTAIIMACAIAVVVLIWAGGDPIVAYLLGAALGAFFGVCLGMRIGARLSQSGSASDDTVAGFTIICMVAGAMVVSSAILLACAEVIR